MSERTRKEQLQELLAEDPNDPFLRYGLAMEHVSAGNDAQAVQCFQDLRAVTPDYVPAYLQEGQALIRLGRTAEARAILSAGILVAQSQRDLHAAAEMQEFLENLG